MGLLMVGVAACNFTMLCLIVFWWCCWFGVGFALVWLAGLCCYDWLFVWFVVFIWLGLLIIDIVWWLWVAVWCSVIAYCLMCLLVGWWLW